LLEDASVGWKWHKNQLEDLFTTVVIRLRNNETVNKLCKVFDIETSSPLTIEDVSPPVPPSNIAKAGSTPQYLLPLANSNLSNNHPRIYELTGFQL
jgi:hypothetical protein